MSETVFRVSIRDRTAPARQIQAVSFSEAAVIYVEDLASAAGEVSVQVQDPATGTSRCFRIDLESGEVGSC